MLRGAAAPATVFLCFVLVLAHKDPRLCSRDAFRKVDTLARKAPKLVGTALVLHHRSVT